MQEVQTEPAFNSCKLWRGASVSFAKIARAYEKASGHISQKMAAWCFRRPAEKSSTASVSSLDVDKGGSVV